MSVAVIESLLPVSMCGMCGSKPNSAAETARLISCKIVKFIARTRNHTMTTNTLNALQSS
ncbi:hypothetical protein CREGCYN_00090 [Synechococcus sp. M16CYN]